MSGPSLNSVPFWEKVLGLSRPREAPTWDRCEVAAAMLSRVARDNEGDVTAKAALFGALESGKGSAPAAALDGLMELFTDETRAGEKDIEAIRRYEARESDLLPRLRARFLLDHLDATIDLDEGLIELTVTQAGTAKDTALLLQAEAINTLDDLHETVRIALKRRGTNLQFYAFRVGQLPDGRGMDPIEFGPRRDADHDSAMPLGLLGARAGDSFDYLLGVRPLSVFKVHVVSVGKKADKRRRYPRVVARSAAPSSPKKK